MSGEPTEPRVGAIGLRWLGAIAVSAVLLGGVLWLGDPVEVWSVVADARLGPLAAATGCYAVVLFARWVRLVGLDPRGRLRPELLGVSAGHSLANQLLPARSGELAFPALWRRATDDGYARGTVYLVAIRAVELGVVVPLFGVALGAWWTGLSVGLDSLGTATVFVAAGVGVVAGFPLAIRGGLWCGERLLEGRYLRGIEWLDAVRDEVPRARKTIDELGLRKRIWLVGTSVVMWVAMFGVFYGALVACGAGVGVLQSVVGSAGGVVGNLVPVGAVGSLGPMEAGWTAAFRATGAAASPVVAAGLLVHGIVVAGTALATGGAALACRVGRSRVQREES